MSDDDVETATRFVLQILGAEIVDGPPPPGTALHDFIRLSEAVERGELTEDELAAEMVRLHPPPPLDPDNVLDPRHPDWRAQWPIVRAP